MDLKVGMLYTEDTLEQIVHLVVAVEAGSVAVEEHFTQIIIMVAVEAQDIY
jgi:hypothetical protein